MLATGATFSVSTGACAGAGEEGLLLRAIRERRQKRRERRWGHQNDIEHLSGFARSRRGVEGYIEPRTLITETTVVLVADSGEWTRRRVAGPGAAQEMGVQLGIPVYDVTKVGYPDRMRAWNRQRSTGRGDAPHVTARENPGVAKNPEPRGDE